jgi:hypothetical protein
MADERLARVIAIMNGKGGVGKTSIAGNLAALAAAAGYRVLVVDLDPQGNLAEEMGYVGTATDDAGAALASAMQFGRQVEPAALRDGLDAFPGVCVAPGDLHQALARRVVGPGRDDQPTGSSQRSRLQDGRSWGAVQQDEVVVGGDRGQGEGQCAVRVGSAASAVGGACAEHALQVLQEFAARQRVQPVA